MKFNLSSYKTIIFDCDGVLLNSNPIKSNAFFESTKKYGLKNASDLLSYHIKNGGISRYEKFSYFFTKILNKKYKDDEMRSLLETFSRKVQDGLLQCEVNPYLKELKETYSNSLWAVISGSDEKELNCIFKQRNINRLFELGIYGSPKNKEENFLKLSEKDIKEPILFVGDSKYDFEVAKKFNLDFIFMQCWSEYKEWKSLQKNENFNVITNFSELL